MTNYDKFADKEQLKKSLKNYIEAFYKDYDVATDQRILTEMFKLYNNEEIGEQWIPSVVRLSPKYAKLNDYDR